MCAYGVATIRRLLKITGLFCKRALQKRLFAAKETYNFKKPTNCSHPTCVLKAMFVCGKRTIHIFAEHDLRHTAYYVHTHTHECGMPPTSPVIRGYLRKMTHDILHAACCRSWQPVTKTHTRECGMRGHTMYTSCPYPDPWLTKCHMWHDSLLMWHDSFICDMTHSYTMYTSWGHTIYISCIVQIHAK